MVVILTTLVLFMTDLAQNYNTPLSSAAFTQLSDAQSQAAQKNIQLTGDYQVSQDENQGVNQQASDTAQLQSLIGTQSQNKDFVSIVVGIWNEFLQLVSVNPAVSGALIGLLTIIIGAGVFKLWRQQTP